LSLTLWIIGGIIAGAAVAAFWDNIRETVADWLRANNLESTWLMSALVRFDTVVGGVKARLTGTTRRYETVEIAEITYRWDEIPDKEIKAELRRSGSTTRAVQV
jgi:hypothetical protein